MTFDLVLLFGLGALAVFLAVIVLVCVVALMRRPGRATPAEERLSMVEQRLGQTEHHVANMRMALGGLPTKEHLHKLELQVSELNGNLQRTAETTLSTSRAVERIETFLMNATASSLASNAANSPAKDGS